MRSKNNQSFKIFLILSFVLTIAITAENVYYMLYPKGATIVIDVEKVKDKINNAGLKPIDAKHWKDL